MSGSFTFSDHGPEPERIEWFRVKGIDFVDKEGLSLLSNLFITVINLRASILI